jgi:hypothetical protein
VCQTFSIWKEATSFIQSDCHRSWKLFKTFKKYWQKPFQFFKTRKVLYMMKCCSRARCTTTWISGILNYAKLFIWFDPDRSIVEDSVRKQICMKALTFELDTFNLSLCSKIFQCLICHTAFHINLPVRLLQIQICCTKFHHTKVTLQNHEWISLHFIKHNFEAYKVNSRYQYGLLSSTRFYTKPFNNKMKKCSISASYIIEIKLCTYR